jgi:hypothetical protein
MAKVKTMADEKTALEVEVANLNAAISGKGLRYVTANTRGKGSIQIKYQAFDSDFAGSLPETVAEFMQLSGVEDEAALVGFLITGFNDAAYKAASDPVAEFVNPAWPSEIAESFKASVKQLVKAGLDLQAVVAMVKPAIDASFAGK